MAEEAINIETQEEQNDFGAQEYLDTLEAIKKSTVSKDKYDKLVAENKQLVTALANGERLNSEEREEREPSVDIAKRLFSKHPSYRSDLAYFTDVLAYRDALIEEGQADPFLPYNHEYIPTSADTDRAEEIAAALKECVEYADGDPSIFTSELKRRGVNINTKRSK